MITTDEEYLAALTAWYAAARRPGLMDVDAWNALHDQIEEYGKPRYEQLTAEWQASGEAHREASQKWFEFSDLQRAAYRKAMK